MGAGLAGLIYPRQCMGCSKPLLAEEDTLCLNCNVYLLPRTAYHHIPNNETAGRFTGRVPVERATSLAYFTDGGLLQHLLHQLKYKGNKQVGRFLGTQLGYELQQTGWAQGIDGIIPVPLHKSKEQARGYNQSAVIAESMATVLQLPVWPNALQRILPTESQTNKTRIERIANMQGAFAVADAEVVTNKHVLLIDDVITTGATLEACALELLKQPGLRISIATIGIAT